MVLSAWLSALLDRAQDPRQTLDYTYAQHQELLRQVRQGVIEVATSRCLLEQQAQRLRDQVPWSEQQAVRALAAGREDLARLALERKQAAQTQLTDLEARVTEAAAEEDKLRRAEHKLGASVEDFRIRRLSLSARYAAAQAQTRLMESLTGVSRDFVQVGAAIGRAEERIERSQARAAAIDALIAGGSLMLPTTTLDPVECELRKLSASRAVEQELAQLQLQGGGQA
jgi:phage shock protein A